MTSHPDTFTMFAGVFFLEFTNARVRQICHLLEILLITFGINVSRKSNSYLSST